MKKRKRSKMQQDLFRYSQEKMQWTKLPKTNRQSTKLLIAQLVLSLFTQEYKTTEGRHAIKDKK